MTTTFRVLLRRALPVFLAVLVLGTSAAQATTVRRMSFTEVVNEAELIAIGKVTAIRNTWNADLGMPFTEVTFSDVEVLKGAVDGAELTLRFLGGRAPDGMTLKVAGMPRFTVGDRAAVFSAGNGLRLVRSSVGGRVSTGSFSMPDRRHSPSPTMPDSPWWPSTAAAGRSTAAAGRWRRACRSSPTTTSRRSPTP